jgi:Tol biopolymer transport system component
VKRQSTRRAWPSAATLILYASRTDFGQNNVLGDLGEGTGGVTEALRHRILLPFTGDYRSFDHVLQHELVHAFQYDIFARGRAGAGLQNLAQNLPPLWFAEGMAEYLSLGPGHVLTHSWVRDAALNGNLPTIEQMTNYPQRFFPYRFGEALWEYIGARWGDEVIGEIMNAVPNVGVERAFKRELGLSLEELSDEWREAMQTKHLPQVGNMERARKFAEPVLNQRRTGGFAQRFIAPSLSQDGKLIAFVAEGSFFRGEVFPDLWLGDAETGKRIKRLVKATFDPDFEELRLLYSQSAFSPDGKYLAFTAQRNGKDVLYLLDVAKRTTVRRYDLPLEVVLSPSFSPDGQQIVVSGNVGGLTDLYTVNVDGTNARRLTNDKFAELQPQWSPDGKSIAFATDRGAETDLDILKFGRWQIATFDLATSRIDVLPRQDGLNLNPMWAPDGKSIAFISDRAGTPNIFLYDFESQQHYQLTNVIGAVGAITEYSPAITWARQADKLAFTYYENGDYTVWGISNPRRLKKEPYVAPTTTVAAAPAATGAPLPPRPDSANMLRAIDEARRLAGDVQAGDTNAISLYRAATGVRASAQIPAPAERNVTGPVSVAQLLDSANMALPDPATFKEYEYKSGLQAEYIARPSIGYSPDNFGRSVFGGTTLVFSDLLGNNRLAVSAAINGRLSEGYFFAGYTNLSRRNQYTFGAAQEPIFILTDFDEEPVGTGASAIFADRYEISRYITRRAFAGATYPLNRFTRFEYGLQLASFSRSIAYGTQYVDYTAGIASQFQYDSIVDLSTQNYAAPFAAYVFDNTLFGYTGPISGRRYRFGIEPIVGNLRWIDYSADFRHYFPILFNFLTFAYRGQASISAGRDEFVFPKYIGRPEFVRGYDREQFRSQLCGGLLGSNDNCSATELLGSRVAFANFELRFPLVRRFELGVLPIALPPVDGLLFFDAGIAWRGGQDISFSKPDNYDDEKQRYVLRSYGSGIRLNLFGFALVRWDYAIPLDRPNRKGYWMWTLGTSF